MAQVFLDHDADLSHLSGKTVAVIGYGNQGRSQALNMRDSGVEVVIGGIRDDSFERAREDGFTVLDIPAAVRQADILCILIPDEAQRVVFVGDIEPELRSGQAVCFAHGYNIRFGHINLPADVDVIMVAPRMIGVAVRETFVAGRGAPAFVAVEQDATGRAWEITLAIAKAVGATRSGALATTFSEETELDLFSEQAIWATITRLMALSFEVLTARGYQPEAVLLETYASGEPSHVFEKMAELGLFRQATLHSRTSQYGTLSRGDYVLPDLFKAVLARVIDEIRDGTFAREWEQEYAARYAAFDDLMASALSHPINEAERHLRSLVSGPHAPDDTV